MYRIKFFLVTMSLGLLMGCGGGSSSDGGSTSSSSSSSSSGGDASSSSSSSSSSSTGSGGTPSGSSSSSGSGSSGSSGGGACGQDFSIQGFATLNGGTTGGKGGLVVYAATGTEIHEALCNRASNSSPVIIHVEGTINHSNTSKVSGSCNTAEDKIEIKDVSNISIIGVGGGALFDELGIHIRNASNIILQNLHIRNVKKSGSPTSNDGDAIGMEANVSNVWVDHVTLEASGGESEGFDALFDLKDNTRYITLSYSILKNSGRGGLVGSGDGDDENNYVTYHHNWYENIDSRTPLLRHAEAHSYNNYFNGINLTGINARMGALIRIENNHFENSSNPILSKDSSAIGFWDVRNNIFENINWNAATCNGEPPGTCMIAFNGSDVPSTTTYDPPYGYTQDDVENVKNIVTGCAGAGVIDVPSGGGSSSSSSGSSSSSSSSSTTSGGLVAGGWTSGEMNIGSGPYGVSGSVISSSETEITFTINRGKFESAKESFFFISREVTGDFEFTANLSAINSPTRTGSSSEQGHVGVMLCIGCTNGSATAAPTAKIGVYDNSGPAVINTYRLNNGGSRVNNETSIAVTPGPMLYLRIARTGDTYTVSYSTDGGVNYVVADTRAFVDTVPATVQVGVYAAQGEDADNGFTFENIALAQ